MFGWATPTVVESHRRERAPRQPAVSAHEVGLRWGDRARFEFEISPEEREFRENGGVTFVWPESRRTSERVSQFSPVWRRYEVWRVTSPSDASKHVDVAVTVKALVPIGEEMQRYVGGGIGYVVDPGPYAAVDRVIHSYVLLTIPPPVLENAEKIDEGSVGEWPSWREDVWSGGTLAAEIGGAPYGAGEIWDR